MFVITNRKNLIRPKCKQITNIRALIQYSTIAFCLFSKTFASSFSIDPLSSVQHSKNQASVGSSSSPLSFLSRTFKFPPLTLGKKRDITLGPFSMSALSSMTNVDSLADASSEATASTALTAGEKLKVLRSKMKELNVDAYIIPSDDPHLSEYVPEAYMRRKFLTGFGGSAGTAVVFQNEACLWTDSRYHNEASLQIDADHWTLMKQGLPKVPSLTKYIAEAAVSKYEKDQKTFRVGIDPFVHAASFEKDLMDAFQEQLEKLGLGKDSGVRLGEIDTLDDHGNLIDEIWGGERPAIPTSPFRVHPLEYAGVSVSEKLEEIREKMKEKKATLCIFSALDDVAYLFNIRAKGDIDTCPVGIAYGIVTLDGVTLFCHEEKLTLEQVKEHLKEAGVTVKPYDGVIDEIKNHLATNGDNAKIWIDKTRSNYAISRIIPEKLLLNKQNPVTAMKACKNKEEMGGMKRAHIVDGAAMANFIAWLENEIVNEGRSVSEVEIDKVLRSYRAQQPGYVEDSFPTIAGVGSNGAIIHYRAKADSDILKHLDTSNPILIDSGGQYTYGTTDVTRTWHFGEATKEFKENYTRVLKGNIGVDVMVFPTKTPGFVLDVFARKSLWEAGLDYGHGTGHGVGAALNVHEGPHSISPRYTNMEAMKKGMVVSNEPGLYEDGKFGIRIENLLECTYVLDEDNKAYDEGIEEGEEGFPEKPIGKKTFLRFNKLTMIPIQKNLMDLKLMTTEELDWLDAYHQEIFEKVSPLLEANSPGLAWLTKACEKIDRKL
mmetsp:Transcript_12829/g.24081  ORF Transcript_12829/g.24081 Transcript_12829/m.24081 type:complete len:772 (+) Transcript_12829:78-2393(+)